MSVRRCLAIMRMEFEAIEDDIPKECLESKRSKRRLSDQCNRFTGIVYILETMMHGAPYLGT